MEKFYTQNTCDRHGDSLNGNRIGSMFSTECICMKCKDNERDDPEYKKASLADHEQIKQGNYSFEGIRSVKQEESIKAYEQDGYIIKNCANCQYTDECLENNATTYGCNHHMMITEDKPWVYIASPLKGDIPKNLANASQYTLIAFNSGVLPITPHRYFSSFLDDTVLSERELGMRVGVEMLLKCEAVYVFGIPSEGVKAEIRIALDHGIPVYLMDTLERAVAPKDCVIESGHTSIGSFKYANSDVINVVIPEGVTIIEGHSFSNCLQLETITFPESLTEISTYSFINCPKIQKLKIPDGVTIIRKGCFLGCTSLAEIELGKRTLHIEDKAFRNCHNLKSVKTANPLLTVGTEAFFQCLKLEEIELAKGAYIGEWAFGGCKPPIHVITDLNTAIKKYQEANVELLIDEDLCYINYHSLNDSHPLGDEHKITDKKALDWLSNYVENTFDVCVTRQ